VIAVDRVLDTPVLAPSFGGPWRGSLPSPSMPIYALGDLEPDISTEAFVHPDAVVIGDVTIGARSSLWPGAVLRGDGGRIVVGERTSIQDNAVLHTTPEWPTIVGSECVLGHQVHLEGCTIEDEVLIGNAAMVLHRCVIGSGAVVAANSVVLNDTDVPGGALAAGTPAVVKPGRARISDVRDGVQSYLERVERYRTELRRIG
jgi:carbonic anhydrase/acetyltransferase-like protein (isoleucine patch superfamily)